MGFPFPWYFPLARTALVLRRKCERTNRLQCPCRVDAMLGSMPSCLVADIHTSPVALQRPGCMTIHTLVSCEGILVQSSVYCAETWSMTEANRKRLEAIHHTCLRQLLNVTWKDKVRNETIRDNTGQDMLEVTVRKRRLRWFGHVQQMEDSRRAKQALEWIPDEKKKRGRPRITWRDSLEGC